MRTSRCGLDVGCVCLWVGQVLPRMGSVWGNVLLSRHMPCRSKCCSSVLLLLVPDRAAPSPPPPAQQKLEQQLAAAQAAAEAAAQQAAAATELAETRLREKAAADKEWGRRLSVKEKEAAAKLKEAEAQLRELQDKGKQQGVLVCCKAERPSWLLTEHRRFVTALLLAESVWYVTAVTGHPHSCYAIPWAWGPCVFVCAGANHWLRLSVAEGELSQHNLAVQRQLEEAADTWGRQMADLQAACEQRVAGAHEQWCRWEPAGHTCTGF